LGTRAKDGRIRLIASVLAASPMPAYRAVIASDVCPMMARKVIRSTCADNIKVFKVRRKTWGLIF